MADLWRVLREPVPGDTRVALSRAWARVPPELRTPRQFLGRQYAGCGALIGAMPRCDFACRGCYLGEDANRTAAASLPEIEGQLRRLREWLGEGGGVQITDGEVTLRDTAELVWVVRKARTLGLIPMLFTHGEGIRRDPELLRRLMLEGGLAEISVHVDTTQRGHRDRRYRGVTREEELHPLRDEFAALIRRLRQETGRPLDAATTVTVTRDNLDGVPEVIRWAVRNADAFKMVSFQPVAQVGRTEAGLGGAVCVQALWEKIAEGLAEHREEHQPLSAHTGWLGHPDCSRFVQGLVRRSDRGRRTFVPLLRPDAAEDAEALEGLLDRFGGLTLRLDAPGRAFARALGVVGAHPRFLAEVALPLVLRLLGRVAPTGRLRFLWDWLRGLERLSYLNIVSHHFMSAHELAATRGRERVDLCVLKVAIGGELLSMCEVNALGLRERYYDSLRAARRATSTA